MGWGRMGWDSDPAFLHFLAFVKVMFSRRPGLHFSLWGLWGGSALGAQAGYGGREDYYVSRTTFPQQLRDKNTQVQSM